jgi:hypothetical protein
LIVNKYRNEWISLFDGTPLTKHGHGRSKRTSIISHDIFKLISQCF